MKDRFITRRYPFFKTRLLPKLGAFIYGIPKHAFGSVDVTNKCNLRCKHCYYYSNEKDELVGDDLFCDKIIGHIFSKTKRAWSCTWVGGEPLLRKGIVERLKNNFRANLIVTNGTIEFPNWKNVSFYVSLDGTKDIHDEIRGSGVYDKLKKNVTDPKNFGRTIRLACCLNNMNKGCIEEMLSEWYEEPNVKEMVFDFYTPVGDKKDDLWIDFDERDKILERLISLKKERYGRFIGATAMTYLLMKKANKDKAIGKKCVFMKKGFAINASGNMKQKCMLGPNADCNRCGCIVPFYLKSLSRGSIVRGIFT